MFMAAFGYAGGYLDTGDLPGGSGSRIGRAAVALVGLGSCFEGGDVGKRHRLIVLTTSAQREQTAREVLEHYGAPLATAGSRAVVSEIAPLGAYCRAENFSQ